MFNVPAVFDVRPQVAYALTIASIAAAMGYRLRRRRPRCPGPVAPPHGLALEFPSAVALSLNERASRASVESSGYLQMESSDHAANAEESTGAGSKPSAPPTDHVDLVLRVILDNSGALPPQRRVRAGFIRCDEVADVLCVDPDRAAEIAADLAHGVSYEDVFDEERVCLVPSSVIGGLDMVVGASPPIRVADGDASRQVAPSLDPQDLQDIIEALDCVILDWSSADSGDSTVDARNRAWVERLRVVRIKLDTGNG